MARSQSSRPVEIETPHDAEAEMGVLGCVMHDNETVFALRGLLEPKHFFTPQGRITYQAMLTMTQEQQPIDEITLGNHLRTHGWLDQVGGLPFIVGLFDAAPVSSNVLVYAEVVLDNWRRRERMEIAEKLRESRGDTDAALEAKRRMDELFMTEAGVQAEDARSVLLSVFRRMEAQEEGRFRPVLTHIPELDNNLNGLEPGFPSFIGARTGNGKTTWLCKIALESVLRGEPVLFVSMEMRNWQVMARMACNLAQVDGMKVLKGMTSKMNEREWDRLAEANAKLSEAPIWFVGDGQRLRLEQIEQQCRHHARDYGVRLVLLDHLRKIEPPVRGDIYQVQSARAEGVSAIAKRTDLVLLCAAQVNRSGADKPQVKDLEGSGVIEQEADFIGLVQIVKGQLQGWGREPDRVVFDIAKSRNGRTGELSFEWEPQFYNVRGSTQERMTV